MKEMRGLKEMLTKLRDLKKNFPDKVANELYLTGQILMTESKRRVPVDTGTLRASGQVSKPERHGRKVSVTLSYGGAASDYAVPVHENLEAQHPHGQAKYLESVLDEYAADAGADLAVRMHFDKKGGGEE
jgi:hypothetical protein